jgi:hypothetical protein
MLPSDEIRIDRRTIRNMPEGKMKRKLAVTFVVAVLALAWATFHHDTVRAQGAGPNIWYAANMVCHESGGSGLP